MNSFNRASWLKALAIWLGVLLGLAVIAESQTPCEGYVIATGILEGAEHEWQEGFANVNQLSLSMRPESPWFQRLKDLRDQPVDILIRPRPKRELQQVVR